MRLGYVLPQVGPAAGPDALVAVATRAEGLWLHLALGHRARGFRRLETLLSMLTLVCGRIPVDLHCPLEFPPGWN